MPSRLGALPLPVFTLPLPLPVVTLPSLLPGICELQKNELLVKEVRMADLKSDWLTGKSLSNEIDDGASVHSTSTCDIILPKATRYH
eukprot:666455-Prymnesium_polylepis.1